MPYSILRLWWIIFSMVAVLFTAGVILLAVVRFEGININRYIPGQGSIVSVEGLIEIGISLAVLSLGITCVFRA